VKVPEKIGFNWSKFGWFGHFTEHVKGDELGFSENGHLRWECPPEGAKDLQGYVIGTKEGISPTGFIGFHRVLKDLQKRGKGAALVAWTERKRDREEKLTERGKDEGDEVAGGWSRTVAAGALRSPVESPERERNRAQQGEKTEPGLGSGREKFLKTEYGRTGQSTVPVRCTPDSAQ
jgi:hypothetical protein